MAYQIKCDGNVIYDLRDDELVVVNPRCRLASNAAGEASFTILSHHPYYDRLHKLSSVFEITQDGKAIFRGRMTDDGKDFDNKKKVELEGALAYFNDSIIRPFSFPEDFLDNPEYQEAAASGNTVRFLLGWFIDQHNSQVSSFQQFKLGNVTVSDPNNYVYKYDKSYSKTLEILKTRLWESSLGGYICVRYEDDGNYIDYLSGFDQTNSQPIVFGENLLDVSSETDSTETYSAIIPLGGEITKKSGNDYVGDYVTIEGVETEQLTLKDLPDGNITDDIVKIGDVLYSRSAVSQYGWIYAPVSATTWDDVTKAENLLSNGVDFLNKNRGFLETVTIHAFDLHLTDSEIEAFRVNKNVIVESRQHNNSGIYPLSEIDIDIGNPQNTKITVGATRRVLTDLTIDTARQLQSIKRDYVTNQSLVGVTEQIGDNLDGLGNRMTVAESSITQTNEEIALKVSKDEFDELGNRVTAAESSITMTAEEIAMKVSKDEFNELGNRVTAAESSITMTAEEIALKVSKDEFDDLGNRVSAAESSITQTAEEIALKVSKGEFDELGNRVTVAESSITQTAKEISLKVSQQDFDTLAGNIDQIVENVDAELTLKVGKDENDQIVSMLNASANVIELKSNRISIESDNFNLSEDGTVSARRYELLDGSVADSELLNGNLDFEFKNGNHIMFGKNYQNLMVCDSSYSSTISGEGVAQGEAVDITPNSIQYECDGSGMIPIRFGVQNGRSSHGLVGNWKVTGSFDTSGTTSDRTLKNGIEPQAEVYSRVFDRLKPVTFKYNHGESDRIHTGFIAQDVEDAIVAEGLTTKDFAAVCYDTDEQGNKSNYRIRYDEIISMCVKEIQDLKCRLSECERRIAEYEGRA